jgi:hypothetical protein
MIVRIILFIVSHILVEEGQLNQIKKKTNKQKDNVWCLVKPNLDPHHPTFCFKWLSVSGKATVVSASCCTYCLLRNRNSSIFFGQTGELRRVWPVSKGFLLLLSTWSYLRICWRSVLPYTWFCSCLLDYSYVLQIANVCRYFVFICFANGQNVCCDSPYKAIINHFRDSHLWLPRFHTRPDFVLYFLFLNINSFYLTSCLK